ncbi:MAG: hypothetical protein V3T84_09415 [Phycisphaerales bacterium]
MTSLCWCACDMWRFRDARQIRRTWRALCLLPPRTQEERKVGGVDKVIAVEVGGV